MKRRTRRRRRREARGQWEVEQGGRKEGIRVGEAGWEQGGRVGEGREK
jgi:hypothetical protein